MPKTAKEVLDELKEFPDGSQESKEIPEPPAPGGQEIDELPYFEADTVDNIPVPSPVNLSPEPDNETPPEIGIGAVKDKTETLFALGTEEISPAPELKQPSMPETETLEVPAPPPELKEKPMYARLQEIEDEYLDSVEPETDMEEIRMELEAETELKKPLFVNLQEYGVLLETMRGAKTNLTNFTETVSRLQNLTNTRKKEFDKINKHFENIQRKLIMIDNALFEEE